MKRQRRILLLFPHYSNIDEASSLRSPQIAHYLRDHGWDVTVFAPGVNPRHQTILPELEGRLWYHGQEEGIRVIRPRCLQYFRRNIFRRFLYEVFFAFSVLLLFFRIPRADVIFAAYPPAILPSVGYLLSRCRGSSYIFEVRDLMADAIAVNKYSRFRFFNNFAVVIENFIYRKADHIVTVSDGIKRIIIQKGFPTEKITPVKNGYEPQVFEQADRSFDARSEFGWGDDFVVIYAGGLTQSYDIPTLLNTAKIACNIKGLRFVIIGEGHRKIQYKNFVQKYGLTNIQILDALPRAMMPSILSAANVGIHLFPDNPLWSYVLGNKPFDYLGSGIPMIYSGTGDTAELVINANAGFVVPPENPDLLLEKILWLMQHPEEARAMGERGKTYVETEYNRFKLLKPLDRALDAAIVSRDEKGTIGSAKEWQFAIKHLFDRIFGFMMLILLTPILGIIAIVIKLEDGHEIFFRQRRSGKNMKDFQIWKFRTMRPDADKYLNQNGSVGNNYRITRVGKILRATSLDELPQIFNIATGDMSFVGPRPVLPSHVNRYTEEQKRRFSVKPGVTGLSQVNGRNLLKWSSRLAYDVEYVDNYSLWLDLKILLKTIKVVLRREGLSLDRNPEFADDLPKEVSNNEPI